MIYDVLSWKIERADSSFPKISQSLHLCSWFPLRVEICFLICLVDFQCLSFHVKYSLLIINKQIKKLKLNPNSSQLDSKPSDHWKTLLWTLASLSCYFLSSLLWYNENTGMDEHFWMAWVLKPDWGGKGIKKLAHVFQNQIKDPHLYSTAFITAFAIHIHVAYGSIF